MGWLFNLERIMDYGGIVQMDKVMVDNWFLEDIINDFRNGKISTSNSYAELLMAVTLWDEVCYPQNAFNWWNSVPSHIQHRLCPLDDTMENGMPNILLQQSDSLEGLVLHYMALSNKYECNYLPCLQRRTSYACYNMLGHALIQMKMQENLDNSIEAYYRETYKQLSDFPQLKIKMPILAKYIFDNTPEGMTPFDFAFHLKNEGPVIRYRQYLNGIENALEKQDWKELRYLLSCSEDAISDVLTLGKKGVESVTFGIWPIPSISLKFRNANVSISESTSFSIKTSSPCKKMHLTFLRHLTDYAINYMKLW